MKMSFGPFFTGLAMLILVLTARVADSAIFTTIVTNGPATNRVNLVFFSEGYTNGQLAKFLTDATNAAGAFLSAAPYAEYTNYFNVFAIFTNSAHAGSTHLNSRAYSPGYTYFNSTYDAASDQVITIPPNPSDGLNSRGQGKIDLLLQQYLPKTNNDLAALLVNDIVDGGSDNYGKTAITSIGNVNYILVHESGHVFGGLADEYTTAYPGYSTNDVEPNTTTNTVLANIKWNLWITNGTPIPTPFTLAYANTVGLFEGGHYHTTGWYRPYGNCCMQSFGVGFCPVCQEALVVAMYRKVRPLQSVLPVTNKLTITNSQVLTFNLTLLQPSTHNLSIQWRTNGAVVGGATGASLDLFLGPARNGTNLVEADVWDATAMVRKDTTNVLKQTNLWTLNVAIPHMQIDTLKWLTNGSLTMRVTGSAPAGVVIQLSTNLVQWTSVKTSTLSGGTVFYTNAAAAGAPKRFFRTKTPP